ncbi:unnamed protein product, partial [Ectocarpus sp. 12 AP-2014]
LRSQPGTPGYHVVVFRFALTFSLAFQDNHVEADPLRARTVGILGSALGEELPGDEISRQGNYPEAVSLNERATEIWVKTVGPEHPTVATALNNRARLLLSNCPSAFGYSGRDNTPFALFLVSRANTTKLTLYTPGCCKSWLQQ